MHEIVSKGFCFSVQRILDMVLPVNTNAHFAWACTTSHKRSVMLKDFSCCSVLDWRKNWICSPELFCAEQFLCSSRTHLMAHWNPIKTTMEQNELLLTWSAGSRWRRRDVTCPVCSLVAHLYFYLIIHTALNSASLPPSPPPTHIHQDFRQAGHYQSQSLWPIRANNTRVLGCCSQINT